MEIAMRGTLCVMYIIEFIVLVDSGLQAEGNSCGERMCLHNEYCSSQSNMCQPCKEVCEKTSHNYQQDTCNKQCQDYLHELRYVTKEEEATEEDLRSIVAHLTMLVTAAVTVSVLILFIMLTSAVTLFFLYRKHQCKQSPVYLESNGVDNSKVNYKTEALKLDMSAAVPPPSTTAPIPVTPATMSTPISSRPRYPKEDPTLEYGAYDNPALTPSPVFDNKTPESTPVTRQESSF